MSLRISDITPFTTIDFPGRLAAVLWCRGCPLDCAYCHNADLRAPCAGPNDPSWSDVIDFLTRRRGRLNGVVFSGGEPLAQGALPQAMAEIRALGYATALHSSGINPARMEKALPLCDWVGFDAKAPFDRYETVTGVKGSGAKALESLKMLLVSGLAYEVRMTVDPALTSERDIMDLADTLVAIGVETFRLQEVSGLETPLPESLCARLAPLFRDFEVRRASTADSNPLSFAA